MLKKSVNAVLPSLSLPALFPLRFSPEWLQPRNWDAIGSGPQPRIVAAAIVRRLRRQLSVGCRSQQCYHPMVPPRTKMAAARFGQRLLRRTTVRPQQQQQTAKDDEDDDETSGNKEANNNNNNRNVTTKRLLGVKEEKVWQKARRAVVEEKQEARSAPPTGATTAAGGGETVRKLSFCCQTVEGKTRDARGVQKRSKN